MRQTMALVLPIGIFLAILLPYLHYIPMWDSGSYLSQCVLDAVDKPFNLMAFNCSNHGSILFGLLYAIPQYISYGNSLYMHLTSFALLIIGFCFYYAILKHFFNDKLTIAIGMALLCWNPAIVANAINPTPDLVVMVFSIICLWCLLNHRIGYAALSGVALLFSKESGVIFYALSSFLYIGIYSLSSTNRRDFILKNSLYLFSPFIVYGIFLWYKTHYANSNLLFLNTSVSYLIKQIFFMNPLDFYDRRAFSTFYAVFLLNFQWVIAVGIMFGMLFLYVKKPRAKNFFHPLENREIMFVFILTLALSCVLSRYPNFFNVRYYLLIFPLSTLLFVYILQEVPFKNWQIYSGVLSILLIFSCFYTIDPASRRLFGTFDFGSRTLLNMTARTGECCGYGRDQLVYNLQHTEIESLLKQFAAQMKLAKNDTIIADDVANFLVYERIGRQHYKNALCLKNDNSPVITKNLLALESTDTVRRLRIFYPQLPNLPMDTFTNKVLAHLEPTQVISVSHNGYQMNIVELKSSNQLTNPKE